MPFSTGNERILITNEPYYTNNQTRMANKNLGWEKILNLSGSPY